jgi:hypothetical protein
VSSRSVWANKTVLRSSQVLVAHAYNPSYSGNSDQEDPGSKPALANSSQDPILKKAHYKKKGGGWAGGAVQGVGSGFKAQYCKNKNKAKITKTTTKNKGSS